MLLQLTDSGRQVLTDWQAAHERRLSAALGRLPAADQQVIGAAVPALSRLVDLLENET